MLSNKLAFAALAVACIAAAAGGGYLASRQNAIPAPASAQTPAAAPVAAAPAPAPARAATTDRAVQETEAVVGDKASPSMTPATSKRSEKPRDIARSTRPLMPPPASQTMRQSSAAAAQQPPVGVAPQVPIAETPVQRPDERPLPPPPPEPPRPQFEEIVVSRDSVIGLQTEGKVSSETAKVEDRVEARVTRDVRVADRIAIPAGSRAIGAVTLVERGGKFKERGRLGIRFHTLVFADGTRLPINTETIYREGEGQGQDTAKKIGGGAVVGSILGGILGGAKGAAIGATAGAGAGTAAAAAGDRSEAVLLPGTPVTARLTQPVTIVQER